jgi:hypothetical protein
MYRSYRVNEKSYRGVIWATGTNRAGITPRLSVQNDGNLVLWNVANNQDSVLWESRSKTLTLRDAVIGIAILPDQNDRNRVANDFAQQLRTSPGRLLDLASRTQTRRALIKNDFLTIRGNVSLLGAEFSPNYAANIDRGGYRVWLDYNPPIFPRGTIDIASGGRMDIEGIRIVDSFSSGRIAAASTNTFARSSAAAVAIAPMAAANVAAPEFVDLELLLSEVTDGPTIEIRNVTVFASKNKANIKYNVSTETSGSVTFFLDSNRAGYNGFQIDDGLLSDDGTHTFTLEDIADRLPGDIKRGDKFYIYAVIDDGVHAPVYSKYSAPIAAPDLDPTLTVPSEVQTLMVDEKLTFSRRNGNAISIKDPILKIEKVDENGDESNELITLLSTNGYGTLHLKNLPATVIVSGNHSNNITLQGTSSDITAALQDMIYDPIIGARADKLTIAVRRANSDYVGDYVSESIQIKMDDFKVNGAHNVNIDPDDGLTKIFSNIDIDSVYSDSINGLFVQIDNYEKGKDLLSLNTDGIEDILADGVRVRFDEELGRLFFGGGGMTEETCEQLLENVEFMTTDSDAAKGVTVRMKNSVDEFEKFSQLLL